MVRWSIYLVCCILVEFVAIIFAPVLPLFATKKTGPINNNSGIDVEPRLPAALRWFDTSIDNGLLGDPAHKARHANSSFWWQATCWLVRNRAYFFKWSVLSAPMDAATRVKTGQQAVGWLNPGFQRIRMGDYWQWHLVKQIGPVTINFNFGWLLNDGDQPRALFMFSPRFRIR